MKMKISNYSIWSELSETGECWSKYKDQLSPEEDTWMREWEDRLNLSYVKIFVEIIQLLEEVRGMEPSYREEFLEQHHVELIPIMKVMLLGLDPHLMIWDMVKPDTLEVMED